MDDFTHVNKVTGIYYLKSNIEDLSVKITIKSKRTVTLPKFADFNNTIESDDVSSNNGINEVHTFKWQEKVFNTQEIEYYSNKNNCVENHELHYYQLIKQSAKSNQLFTYTNEDRHNTRHSPFEIKNGSISNLESFFQRLNLNERVNTLLNRDTESRNHLFKSQDNLDFNSERWISMHIMFDYSVNNDEPRMSQEAPLISLYWNQATRCLVLKPDANNFEWNPYTLETFTGLQLNYEYAVEIVYGEEADGEDEDEFKCLLKKLQNKWDKDHTRLLEFSTPPVGIKRHYVTIEIISAKDFEMDNLYIEYIIKIPDKVLSKDVLKGRTHTAKSAQREEHIVWNFSHLFELQFDCDSSLESPKIAIFLEIISTDWWGNHRTEGYSHLSLLLKPGYKTTKLLCVRPEETDRVMAESRRFFVGGCHLLEDLDVLEQPQEYRNHKYKFTTTGSVTLRTNVISQSPLPSSCRSRISSASGLLKTADAVLRQYRLARDRLAAATRDLEIGDYNEHFEL